MDNPIITGIASFGMSGRVFHAPLLALHKHFSIKRILQRHGSDVQTLYPRVSGAKTYGELLDDEEIRLIVVNTPDRFHFEMAKQALEAGKHVVVEKPFTQTPDEAAALIRIAKDRNLLLTVFQNRRWDGDYLTVKKVIEEKMLGQLVEFESHFDRYRPIINAASWKEQSSSGAGAEYNLGSHMIDQALVLFGKPEAVTAQLGVVRPGGSVHDWYDIRLHYPRLRVSLRSSYMVRELGPRYILHGTLGSFLKWGLDPQETALTEGKIPGGPGWGRESEPQYGILHTEKDGSVFRERVETQPGNYLAFYDSVYEALSLGAAPAVTAEEGMHVVQIIDAARRSATDRRTVAISDW